MQQLRQRSAFTTMLFSFVLSPSGKMKKKGEEIIFVSSNSQQIKQNDYLHDKRESY